MGDSLGGGPRNLTSTSTTSGPPFAVPYQTSYLGSAFNYAMPGGQLRQYPNPAQQVMGFTPAQVMGMNQATQLAAQGSPAAQSGNVLANQTLQGKFLDPATNPWLRGTYEAATGPMVDQYRYATQPGIQSAFAQAGNFGSSAQGSAEDQARFSLARSLGDVANQMYGGNYQAERDRQATWGQMLPSLISSQFLAPQELMDVGGQQQQFGQRVYDTAFQNMQQFNQWPQQMLDTMGRALPAAMGNASSTVSTQPNPYAFQNPLQSALGLGLGGYGLGGLLGLLGRP